MTKLKYWLVVLLALILPVKGAMATAGMLCHVPASQQVQVSHGHVASASHESSAASGSHDASHGSVQSHHGEAGAAGTSTDTSCLACAAVCAASPLPPAPLVSLPPLEPARDWQRLALVAPPSLALAGLERPPRSL
jgi:hypothetical protein